MSVIQISKIQVRRGKKLSNTNIPQLSSAEFAWAIDTQELFIGNGSVAEGAPYVGNTKILTEHDNILELAGSYRFRANDPTIITSVPRSLQSKIDEIEVSITDFGAKPDGNTDCTDAFENAFEELYGSTNATLRKKIKVPNGIYLITRDLKIPSNAIIEGENKLETVIRITNKNLIFISENGTAPGSFTTGDIPENISISNIKIEHTSGQTIITASKNCNFNNVRWQSNYVLGSTVFVPENANGVYNIPIVSSGGNITITGFGVSTTINQPFTTTYVATLNTLIGQLNADPVFSLAFTASAAGTSLKITAKSSTFTTDSIVTNFTVSSLANNLAGSTVQFVSPVLKEFTDGSQNVNASVFWENDLFGIRTSSNSFTACEFYSTPLAIECTQGDIFETEIKFDQCKFSICDTGIYIGGVSRQRNNWRIIDCEFEQISNHAVIANFGYGIKILRSKFKNCGTGVSTSQYPETSIVKFGEKFDNVLIDCSSDRHQASSIVSLPNVESIVEFENASWASLIDRNYSDLALSDSLRPLAVFPALNKSVVIDYTMVLAEHSRTGTITLTVDEYITEVSITDNYSFSSGGLTMTNFEFSAELKDNNIDSTNDTILLKYRNPTATGALGSISYSISYGV